MQSTCPLYTPNHCHATYILCTRKIECDLEDKYKILSNKKPQREMFWKGFEKSTTEFNVIHTNMQKVCMYTCSSTQSGLLGDFRPWWMIHFKNWLNS